MSLFKASTSEDGYLTQVQVASVVKRVAFTFIFLVLFAPLSPWVSFLEGTCGSGHIEFS